MQLTNRTIRTTIRYSYLDLLDWFDRQNANVIGLLIAALLGMGLVGTIVQLRSAPSMAPAPTPVLPVIVIQKEVAPAPAQQVVAQLPAAPVVRWVTAFGGPDMNTVLGPIPMPDASAITGRWGDSWVSTIHEGATVWIRVSELGASLANLAPAVAPAPAPQPAYAPQPQYQISNQGPPAPPEPTPEPAQPALVSAPKVEAPAAAPVQQERYPKIVPAFPVYEARPGGPSEVDFINITEAWKQEHCIVVTDPTTCLP
jgi:hypothetical protein